MKTDLQTRREGTLQKEKVRKNFSKIGLILKIRNTTEMILAANKGTKIENFTEKEIRQLLARVLVIVGFRAEFLPQEAIKTMIINYILDQFADLTIEEFELAFILGVQKKILEPDKKGRLVAVDMEHYNVLSYKYLENVIQAYRKFISPIFVKERQKQMPVTHQIKAPRYDVENSINSLADTYSQFLKKGDCVIDAGSINFKKLKKIGLITITEEELKKVKVINKNIFSAAINGGGNLSEAKLKKLNEFFKELKEMEISQEDFKEMLKEKMSET